MVPTRLGSGIGPGIALGTLVAATLVLACHDTAF